MLRNAPLSAVLNEEIALEGLEGTTLDTLWNHLAIRLKMKMPLPRKFCDTVWPLVVQNGEYTFFELPEPRKPFVYFDRMEQVDASTGIMREPKEYPGHRFKYNPISDQEGIRGSCECYETRTVVARQELATMSFEDVENRWSHKFVIVASQKIRESFIIDPNCTHELSLIQYCMLEWIARSRYNGETSQGKYSLVELTKDSSILYYNRKFLTDCKLITRQSLCQRTGETSIQGMVYHLPRYYNEMKPKQLLLTEKVVSILKQRPDYMADYEEIKHIVLGRAEARKWFRCNEFVKFVRTDETVPYRKLYPDAAPREYQMKNKKGEEKHVRIMRLIDPDADVYDLWYSKEEAAAPEDEQKDGILNSQKAYIDIPVLQHAYNVIAKYAEQGISQSTLATEMGLDRLNARAVVKNLMRLKAVEGSAVDEGRQRTTKYFIPGISQRTISFDMEAIQLMSNHHQVNMMEQHQPQQQQQLPALPAQQSLPQQLLPPPTALSIAPPPISSETSSLSISVDEDDDDDSSLRINSKLYATTSNSMLESIDVELSLGEDVPFMKKAQGGITAMFNTKHISAKVLKRCNLILELVKTFKVIEPREILKKINRDERTLGYKAEACHKSVLRLLGKLAVDKYLRIATVKLTKEGKDTTVVYACDMSVEEDNATLKGKIEATKARMMLSTAGQTFAKKQALESESLVVGFSYQGTLAKCLRMKLFHEVLFYLVYMHPSEAQCLQPKELEILDLSDLGEAVSPIYSTDGWKMFIPPLNVYESYGQGWALLTDVTLRLPLSVFCQVCTFGFYTKELDYWLEHPIRKHMLLKQLPKHIRQQLFRQRKYIFNIFELCQKLCYAGLIQFGPQRMKDRDQTFIYVNRNASLLDTRASSVGYHEIENREYTKLDFNLCTIDDLNSYWENLYSIAMETRLNRRSVAFGKEIMVQQLQVKPEMVEACRARTPEEAYRYDTQRLPPGDHRGAAGMDTALFVHLKSNWCKVMNYAPLETCKRARIKRLKTMKKIATMNKEKGGPVARPVHTKKLAAAPGEKKLCLKSKLTVKPFASTFKRYGDKKRCFKIRRIEQRPQAQRKRNCYDEVDKKALKLMKKLRVDWARNEDAVLLACRIAVRYLYGDVVNTSTVINSVLYRDILHWSDRNSLNKTSRSCQRRINYMVKQKPGVAAHIKLCVEEARLNPVLEARFGKNFLSQLKDRYPNGDELAMALKVHFVELVFMMRKTLTKMNSDSSFRMTTTGDNRSSQNFIPDTVEEFQQRYNILQSHNKAETLNFDANPKSTEEIIVLKLATLIHSAVTNTKANTNFNVQLFNIYKNYSEKHLSQAMKLVRSFRLISLSKKLKMKQVVPSNLMPTIADNPYHVSITYINQISTKIPFESFGYVYHHYLQLLDRANYDEPVIFEDSSQGLMLLVAELLTMGLVDQELEAPEDIIQMHTEHEQSESSRHSFSEPLPVPAKESPAKHVKTEPRSGKKIHFDTSSDVYFNYVMHPIEKLTKIPSEYMHFFCLLNSLYSYSSRMFRIDESQNICSVPGCLMQTSYRNPIQKCIAIALGNRDAVERIKLSKTSRIEMTPMLVVREDNILQIFNKTLYECTKIQASRQKKDLGKIADGMKSHINMVELADEIIRFDTVRDFNWLDRYEITQVDEEEAQMDEAEPQDTAFSHDTTQKDESNDKDRTQTFYSVSHLKMNLRLKFEHPSDLQLRALFNNCQIPRVFLPQNFDHRQEILNKITNDALWPSRDELQPLLEQATPLVHQNPRLSVLTIFIESKNEFGATVQELAETFRNRVELAEDLNLLCSFKFILRTGFRHVTYVHWKHVSPWLLKTTCVIKSTAPRIKQEPGTSSLGAKRPREISSDEEEEMNQPPAKTRREEIKRQLEVAEERNRHKPKKNLSLSMTPWLRIDGGINRRLLYRWLTTLLLYCMSHPGVLLNVIYSRFNMMVPVHLNNLLDILQEYGCIRMYAMEVRQKKSLFSTFRPAQIENATEFDRDEHTYVEAAPNALSILSVFIGDYPKFQDDFLLAGKQTDAPEEPLPEEDSA